VTTSTCLGGGNIDFDILILSAVGEGGAGVSHPDQKS